MNTQQLVELVTDAVTGAVREALPRMIAEQLDTMQAKVIGPALARFETSLDALRESTHERITNAQADFASRAIAAADVHAETIERVRALLTVKITEQVANAVAGIVAPAGPAGPAGPPGRNATFTPPVHWQAGQVFAAGSVVAHRCGLWYASQDTGAEPGSGVDGYTLMFDGHEFDGFEHDADGFQVAVLRYASGRVRKVPTGARPITYKGVFDPDTNYRVNDCVTAAGSMWTCRAPEAKGVRPGTDAGARIWQLTVKSGRDGRDGRDGAQGPRGERGETGPPGATVVRAPKQKANGVAS